MALFCPCCRFNRSWLYSRAERWLVSPPPRWMYWIRSRQTKHIVELTMNRRKQNTCWWFVLAIRYPSCVCSMWWKCPHVPPTISSRWEIERQEDAVVDRSRQRPMVYRRPVLLAVRSTRADYLRAVSSAKWQVTLRWSVQFGLDQHGVNIN